MQLPPQQGGDEFPGPEWSPVAGSYRRPAWVAVITMPRSLPGWSWRAGNLCDSSGPLSQAYAMSVCEFLQVNPPARA